jgi:hypothetical protein
MFRIRLIPTLVLSLVAMLACGEGEVGSATDSGLDAPDRTLDIATQPVFSVGGFDAPDWATFGEVSNVAFDDRGHLFVLDGQANIVTEVDASGEFVRTIGRPGEGPGELSSPFAFTLTAEGGVAIFDLGHRGWVVYDAEGEFIGNVQVDMGEIGLPGSDVSPHPLGGAVGSVGGRIRMGGPGASSPGSEEELAPSRPVTYFALSEADSSRVIYSAWDMPEAPEGEEQNLTTSGGGAIQLRMPVLRAFEPGLHSSVLPDGRIAVVDSIGYRVKIVDLDGAVTAVLERPIQPTTVTAGIQERERDRRREEAAEESGGGMVVMIGGGGGTQTQAGGMSEMMRARIESMIFAEEIPVIERIAADRAGRIWVQRSSGTPGEAGPTDVLTVDGRYLGTLAPDALRIPSAFGPNGLMVRIEEDEFDVPTLVVDRMRPEIG